MAPAGEERGVLARAAPGVQDRPRDLVGHVEDRFLWSANIPGRLPGVDGPEGGAVVNGNGRSPWRFVPSTFKSR